MDVLMTTTEKVAQLRQLMAIYEAEGRAGLSAKAYGMLVLNGYIDDDFDFGGPDC